LSLHHPDCGAWLYFYARSMENLATIYDNQTTVTYYSNLANAIMGKMLDNNLDPKDKIFKDVFYNKQFPEIISFSYHLGYPNLLPFVSLIRLSKIFVVDDSRTEILNSYLDFIENEETIWSDYGIRSLNLKDEFFGVGRIIVILFD
jgi:mannosyl-oligosaccharide glucosidase